MNMGCESYRRMTRRQWLRATLGAGGAAFLGLLDPRLLYAAPGGKGRHAETVILLWMGGGMSHLDTLDPQPGTDFGGPYEAIETAVHGLYISEYLPQMATQFGHLSLIRSMTSREFDHGRATYQMHTGYPPLASMQHATLGSILAKNKGPSRHDANLPPYVTIGIDWAAGYLGPRYGPFYIADPTRATRNLRISDGIGQKRFQDRLRLLRLLDGSFKRKYPKEAQLDAYEEHFNAARLMMRPETARVFDLDEEPMTLREAYGRDSGFGQGCLLARRLAERGVRVVEVAFGGWDTHQDNFETVKSKSDELDAAVATLIQDLVRKEVWDRTVLVLASEFGRTPRINDNQGRDHYPQVWSIALGGGGLVPGRVIGASDQGRAVKDRPVQVGDLHATICKALGVDFLQSNYAPDGRPFRIVRDPDATPIRELFA